VSTSPEIMRTLMAGEEDDEWRGRAACLPGRAVAGFAERHPDAIADVEIARHRPMSRDSHLRQLQARWAHDVSDRLERIPGAGSVSADTEHIPEVERVEEVQPRPDRFL
jgi:hypothetical protein